MAEIVAVADTDAENLELFCRRYKLKAGYASYEEMLEKEEIDIAAPILPVNANPAAVMACAQAGVKAIMCEKPMAATLEDADRMVETCKAKGITFAAGDMDRNLPPYWKAREIIESGELGEVQSINILHGSGTEISGGGCQQLSLLRMFAGDADVAWVIGWMAEDPFSDYDQGAAGYFRFVNGIEGFMHRKSNAKNGIEVLCSRGVFHSDVSFLHLWKAKEGVEQPTWATLEEVKGVFPETSLWEGSGTYDADGWRYPGNRNIATVVSVIEALEHGTEPRSSGDNGRKVLEMAIGLRESHRRGHVPVQLPLKDRSLRLFPHKSRWFYKKEVYGQEWYAKQMTSHKRG
jgi:predicted dehydrogenase